ncbi:MAG: antigen [Nocardioides sp.]|nr:antigen [Nocardioides sp.]
MSQVLVATSGLVRVTVASGSRRVDLVLPGAVPVAELVPELARSVGLLDAATVHGGYRLMTPGGRELASDAGLIGQGIEDGRLLMVRAGVDDRPPRVYDDVVEAMADVVERDLKVWEPASGRRLALGAAGLLMGLGAVALLLQRGTLLPAVAAATFSVALLAGAIVLSRSRHEPEAAVAVAWLSAVYAAVAGPMLVTGGPSSGDAVASAGAGALSVGLLALVGLGEGRAHAIPSVVVGAVFLAAGLVMRFSDGDPAVVLTTSVVLVVLAGSVFPMLALAATGATVEQLYLTSDPADVDPFRLGVDARVAHEILVALSATVGLLLVLVAPLAVHLGLPGTLLAVVACLVVLLRARQYRAGAEVLVGLVSGVLGLASVAVSLLWMRPDWRPAAAAALAATGVVLLVVTVTPSTPSVRRSRLGDIAESVSVLALLPLLVVATGVFAAVRG